MADPHHPIQARRLTKEFGYRRVLRDIDLELCPGELVALTGANGAGKTTLLGCLAAIVRPTAGEVRWFGCPAGDTARSRRQLGMVAHESRLYPQLTLEENLVLAGRLYGLPQPKQRAEQMLVELGLAAHGGRLPKEISRGMRQRAALGRALQHDPPIVLLDEPFTGLDIDGAEWLTGLLRGLRQLGRAVCFTTHDRNQAQELADRQWHLQDGRLVEGGVRLVGGGVPIAEGPLSRAA